MYTIKIASRCDVCCGKCRYIKQRIAPTEFTTAGSLNNDSTFVVGLFTGKKVDTFYNAHKKYDIKQINTDLKDKNTVSELKKILF
ncbi:hypothetical protein AYI69_g4084 [Smittium culicis]|uniref:Uncharacterized protein n=1 Tax=Smittium culicis TaxID=133412 RepID=A0A1R1X2W3_9FUNG|nr:hypothetical protein AYI69_g10867 [Smittium culicis]OMJ26077.1 hypothetical protein AYI69_g4084 [Smittium culicis]